MHTTSTRQRDTKQRQAIRNALERAGRPLGPKEILDYACRDVPRLGIATVYRNVKSMLARDEIEEVEIPGQISRYQIPSDGARHLFIDEEKDQVHVIEPDLSQLRLGLPGKYRTRRVQVICYGAVHDGAPAASGRSRKSSGRRARASRSGVG